jgi:hypothetical protein
MEYKEVIEHYNNGQNEIIVNSIYKRDTEYSGYMVEIRLKKSKFLSNIGFYEWLSNKKYGVSDIFYLSPMIKYKNNGNTFEFKEPEYILNHFANQIKNKA